MKLYAKPGFETFEQGLAGLWCPVLTGRTDTTLYDCNPSTSNQGTLTNFSNLNSAWVGSQYGSVLDIQNNQSVDCGLAPALNFTGPFSVAAWVRNISGISPSRDCGIVSKLTSVDGYAGWGLDTTIETNAKIAGYWGSGFRVTGATVITSNTNWLLVGIDWTGSTARAWVNGLLDGSNSTAVAPNSAASTLHLGKYDQPGYDRSIRGDLGEAFAWKKALTDEEWKSLYRLGPGGAWQRYPRRPRSYFAQVLTTYRNRSSRYLCFPG